MSKGRVDLPAERDGATSVPYGDTFLLVGGIGVGDRDEIYKFNPDLENWVQIGRLDIPRARPAAMLITPTNVASSLG